MAAAGEGGGAGFARGGRRTTRERSFEWGANTPWNRVRCAPSGGTSARRRFTRCGAVKANNAPGGSGTRERDEVRLGLPPALRHPDVQVRRQLRV
jgi:hypothetical protein